MEQVLAAMESLCEGDWVYLDEEACASTHIGTSNCDGVDQGHVNMFLVCGLVEGREAVHHDGKTLASSGTVKMP